MEPGEDLLRIQQEQDNRDGLDRLVNSLVSQGTPLRGSIRNAVPSTEPFPEAPTVSINKPRVSPLYTNMPDVKAANPNAIFIDNRVTSDGSSIKSANTQISDSIFEGLRTQMDTIGKEEDVLKQQTGIIELQASAAKTAAEISKTTRELAESQVGLPDLQAALQNAERLDRADPAWNQHLVDSNETKAVRLQVERAQSKALELTKRLITENPTIMSMTSTLDSFIKVTNANIQKKLGREDLREEQVDQLALSMSGDGVKAMSYLVPSVANDPKKAAALGLTAQRTKDENIKPLISSSFTKEQLLPLAFTGNKAALQIAPKMHADLTGQNEEEVRKELNKAHAFVTNEAVFLDDMADMAATDPKFRVILSEYTTKAKLATPSKALEAEKLVLRMDIVDKVLKKRRTAAAINNVETWNGDISLRATPELAATIDSIKIAKPGNVSLKVLVEQYVTKAPKEQQAARMQQINDAAKSYGEKADKGLYGGVDLTTLQSQLKLSRSLFSSKAFDSLQDFEDPNVSSINPIAGLLGVR